MFFMAAIGALVGRRFGAVLDFKDNLVVHV